MDLYNKAKLNKDMLAKLQTNPDNIFKINSDSMFLYQVIMALRSKLISKQKRLLSGKKVISE